MQESYQEWNSGSTKCNTEAKRNFAKYSDLSVEIKGLEKTFDIIVEDVIDNFKILHQQPTRSLLEKGEARNVQVRNLPLKHLIFQSSLF